MQERVAAYSGKALRPWQLRAVHPWMAEKAERRDHSDGYNAAAEDGNSHLHAPVVGYPPDA